MVGFGRSGGGGGSVEALGILKGGVVRFFGRNPEPTVDEKLLQRLSGLEQSIDKLERQIKALQLDWENAYDRLHSLMGRVSKRAQIASKAEEMHDLAESQHLLAPLSPPEEEIARALLTPRQKQLQASILMRRRQHNGRGET